MSIFFPDKKYDIIVADPPWSVKKLARRARPKQVAMDYRVMSVDAIAELPVEGLATSHTLCFLWTTQKFLWDAPAVLKAWGFTPLLTMVWEKTYGRSAGMPLFGFRWNAEFVLLGYRSKPELWPKRKLIPCVFQAENTKHSRKPDRFYEMVEVLGSSRIDLFARRRRDGWDVWGDEVD